MTPLQERFVAEYVKDFNATRAAIEAGYSKRSASRVSFETLGYPRVQKAIRKALDKHTEKAGVTTQYVISNLKEIVRRNLDPENERPNYAATARALDTLAKYLGMFKADVHMERVTFNINVGSPKQKGISDSPFVINVTPPKNKK
jgi:phage terminase small subunit